MSEQIDRRIPVSVITGFLGAGKSTLLNRLLRHPDMGWREGREDLGRWYEEIARRPCLAQTAPV